MAAVQPQPGYGAPMAQLGMPPVAGTPGMHPGGYQGKKCSVATENTSQHETAEWSEESLCIFCILRCLDVDLIYSFFYSFFAVGMPPMMPGVPPMMHGMPPAMPGMPPG